MTISRWELWLLGIVQGVATAFMLIATAEIEGVVTETLKLHKAAASLQVPLPAIAVLAAAPVLLAALATLRQISSARLSVWFAILFLLSVAASSAQAFGAWRLWSENVPPTATATKV